ncbi:MAG: J domain-containing protein [Alphaproteobacteria bacterium]|nr:J domain-containing protein [Alphaproteobacteria bacterium]
MKDSFSYYDILGIPNRASDDDIKRAYLNLAKKYHPDYNPHNRKLASHRFQAILEAYEAIKTREKRAAYNRKLRLAAENDNQKPAGDSIFSKLGTLFTINKQPHKETQK